METIKVETIKPFSIIPNRPQTLNLSIIDYFLPETYTSTCQFYTKNSLTTQDQTTNKLKTSLSKTLTKFYPLAGRISNRFAVDCNDEGVIFVEARFNDCNLSSFLTSPDFETIKKLFALDVVDNISESVVTWPLMLVKATYFQCGGLAIGVCISHKLADAASLSNFVRSWAAVARGESDAISDPEFAGATLYPPANDVFQRTELQTVKTKTVTKRFVFGGSSNSGGSKIEELRTKAASTQNGVLLRPTRVESVTALIWRCVVAASSSKTSTKVLARPLNLRPKLPSLLPKTLFGNLIHSTTTFNRKGEIEIQETIKELRESASEVSRLIEDNDGSLKKLGSTILGIMSDEYSKLSQEAHEMYSVSSWSRLPFYEADFGTGRPVWVVGNVTPILYFVTLLVDTNDFEGIEAWVTLSEEDMVKFELNHELLAFASPNPPVIF